MANTYECEACSEMFNIDDLHDRNECGCKLICDTCIHHHDEECEDYKQPKKSIHKELLSKEECRLQIQILQNKIDYLKQERKECKETIRNKVKGEIRKSQKRKNEIDDEIHTLRCRMDPYRNRGVW